MENNIVKCPKCEKPITALGVYKVLSSGETFPSEQITLVGYGSPPGHNHDDNCLTRVYICEGGCRPKLSLQRVCKAPGCDWKAKTTCWCHDGEKLATWPAVTQEIVILELR